MDDGDETEQRFKLLSKDIANVSLAELVDKIHENIPTGSREVYLDTFITWLHERLSVIDNSDEAIFNTEVDSWCTFLAEFGFEREAIVQGFDEWKRSQSVADPSSSRRLNFAGMRIVHVLFPPSPEEAASGDTATTQPDRALLGFDDADPDDEEPAAQDDGSLSFLTGANAMVHGRSSIDHGSPALPLVQHTASPSPSSTLRKTKTKKAKVSSNYICNRCGGGGHLVTRCPTNMDPSYDSRPYPPYICNICGAEALHYTTMCPQNVDRDSITQQRIRHAKKIGLVAKRHGPGFRAPSPEQRFRRAVRHIPYSPERHGWDDEPPRHREEGGRRSGWRDWSPQPRDRYPLRDIRSPRRRSRSPRRDDPHPFHRYRSPRRLDSSPHQWARSPGRDDPHPYYRHRSPRRLDSSPHPWARSPGRGERSPHPRPSPRRGERSPHPRARSPRRNNPSPYPRDRDYDRFTRDHARHRSISPLPRARHSRPSSLRPSIRSSRTPAHPPSVYAESRNTRSGMSSDPVKGRGSSMAVSDHPSGSFSFHDQGAEPKSSPEEGETFSDESENQAGNDDGRGWKQPAGFAEALDGLIGEMSDIWLPEKDPIYEEPAIELGVTPKSLDRKPPYDPVVLGLFRNKPNVWTHRVERKPAWGHWVDTGAVKAPADSTKTPVEGDVHVDLAPKPSTGEALNENMDLDPAPPQDDPSNMQQEETGGTENQPQTSNMSEGPEEDQDVVMEDTDFTEEPTRALPGHIVGQENTANDSENTWTGPWGRSQASTERTGIPEEQDSSPAKALAKKRLVELEEKMAMLQAKISQAQDGGTDQ